MRRGKIYSDRGTAFTLVEVLVVVVVLGIIAAMVTVNYVGAAGDARLALAKDLERTLRTGAAMYLSKLGRMPSGFSAFVSANNPYSQSFVQLNESFLSQTVDKLSVQHIWNDRIVCDFGTVKATYYIDASGTITATYVTP